MPAAVIVSRGFSEAGRTIGACLGNHGLPLVEMDHPLAEPTRELLHPKADAIVDEAAEALTGDAEALQKHYRQKKLRGPDNVCPKSPSA